jgi:hypothetical protein
MEKKQLFVGLSIKKIDLIKKEITFSLKFQKHLVEAQNTASQLLKDLLQQEVDGIFSKLPVRGLELHWDEYSGKELK